MLIKEFTRSLVSVSVAFVVQLWASPGCDDDKALL